MFHRRVALTAMLLYLISGFGNASPGQDNYGRRRSIHNLREADAPVVKTQVRKRRTSSNSNGRRPQILRIKSRGWSARGQQTKKSHNVRRASAQRSVGEHKQVRFRKPAPKRPRVTQSAFRTQPAQPRRAPKEAPLRWRSPDRRVAQSRVRGSRAWRPAQPKHEVDPGVKRAAHLAPLNPFDDPFGDQQAQHTETIPAPQQRSVLQSNPDSQPSHESRPNRFTNGADEPPSPVFVNESANSVQPPPKVIRRDCAAELQKCKSIVRNPLTQISLDITPSLRSTVRGQRNQASHQLRNARARTWKNRAGEIVAEGKLTNLAFGEAVITDGEGNTRRVPVNHLSDADLCVVATLWNLPAECILDDDPYVPRRWLPSTLTWKASAVCHKPLYFEQVQLERYGHTAGPIVQPVVSGAHFFASLAFLPYKMGINPPTECYYPLGYYRPGNCAPWLLPPVPLSVRGALMEAGVLTGGAALLP